MMMPPSLSPLEGEDRRDEKVGKYCGDGLLGYKERVSRVCACEES